MTTETIEKIPTDWNGLVAKFYLLKPIHTKGDYNRAMHIIEILAGRTDLNKDQEAYLESLSILVEAYENEHFEIEPKSSPLETLTFLLEENGLTGSDLGRILGQRQLGSKILRGERDLSKAHIKTLADYFSVDPGLFL
jgi:antitoxin component HigA of HigAB toxin-antitoxin module